MVPHVRGEQSITIAGEVYQIAPTFKAISMIEQATGKGLAELVDAMSKLEVNTMATVLFNALRANGFNNVTFDQVGEAIIESMNEGAKSLNRSALDFIMSYFGKPKAAEGKKPIKARP